MTKREKYECDVTGELYGAKNAGDGVIEFEIRRHRGNSPFNVSKETVHISMDKLCEEIGNTWPQRVKYLGVERGEDGEEVVGMCNGFKPNLEKDVHYKYEERESVVIDHYEPFFQFVEDEFLY